MGANCIAWWRADLGVTIDTGVSEWLDQVAGLALTQGTGANQPTLNPTGGPNSTPSILFDGANDSLAGGALARALPQTIWLIGRQISWTANDSWVNDSAVTLIILQRTTTPQIAQSNGTGANNNAAAILNTYVRVQAEFTNSTSDRLLVIANSVTGTNAGSTAGTAPLVGRNAAASTFGHIELCELAFFNAIPSAGQNTQLNTYTTGRYGAGLV
jgi:hypothetical protein